MSLNHSETVTYIDDAITALDERLTAFNDASTMQEFTDAVDAFKEMAEEQTGYLTEAKTAVEDKEFFDEYAHEVADDLESSTDTECAEQTDDFREGFEAAIQWIRDNY